MNQRVAGEVRHAAQGLLVDEGRAAHREQLRVRPQLRMEARPGAHAVADRHVHVGRVRFLGRDQLQTDVGIAFGEFDDMGVGDDAPGRDRDAAAVAEADDLPVDDGDRDEPDDAACGGADIVRRGGRRPAEREKEEQEPPHAPPPERQRGDAVKRAVGGAINPTWFG